MYRMPLLRRSNIYVLVLGEETARCTRSVVICNNLSTANKKSGLLSEPTTFVFQEYKGERLKKLRPQDLCISHHSIGIMMRVLCGGKLEEFRGSKGLQVLLVVLLLHCCRTSLQ